MRVGIGAELELGSSKAQSLYYQCRRLDSGPLESFCSSKLPVRVCAAVSEARGSVGDAHGLALVQAWTNDVFLSNYHRVVNPPPGANSLRTVAMNALLAESRFAPPRTDMIESALSTSPGPPTIRW